MIISFLDGFLIKSSLMLYIIIILVKISPDCKSHSDLTDQMGINFAIAFQCCACHPSLLGKCAQFSYTGNERIVNIKVGRRIQSEFATPITVAPSSLSVNPHVNE